MGYSRFLRQFMNRVIEMKTNRNIQSHCVCPGRLTVLLALVLCLLCAACPAAAAFEPVHTTVTEIDQFGDILFDLEKLDLAFGDSVDISFSGGAELKAVPYYPGFFGPMGSDILTVLVYSDTVAVARVMGNSALALGVRPGETATITLEQKGRYLEEYKAYDIADATYKAPGQTDEEYLNAREVTAGGIRPGRLYRGGSPFDPEFHRVELMGAYIAAHDIRGILDLADSPEALASFRGLPAQTAAMISGGRVISCSIGVDFLAPDTMRSIGGGLAALAEAEGPWLIHCSLGRDRTGFLCAMVEALCGASYDEIVRDFMLSYRELHAVDIDSDNLQYRLFKAKLDEPLSAISGIAIEALPRADMQRIAVDYLLRCGMTQAQLDRLADRLTRADAGEAGGSLPASDFEENKAA